MVIPLLANQALTPMLTITYIIELEGPGHLKRHLLEQGMAQFNKANDKPKELISEVNFNVDNNHGKAKKYLWSL